MPYIVYGETECRLCNEPIHLKDRIGCLGSYLGDKKSKKAAIHLSPAVLEENAVDWLRSFTDAVLHRSCIEAHPEHAALMCAIFNECDGTCRFVDDEVEPEQHPSYRFSYRGNAQYAIATDIGIALSKALRLADQAENGVYHLIRRVPRATSPDYYDYVIEEYDPRQGSKPQEVLQEDGSIEYYYPDYELRAKHHFESCKNYVAMLLPSIFWWKGVDKWEESYIAVWSALTFETSVAPSEAQKTGTDPHTNQKQSGSKRLRGFIQAIYWLNALWKR